MWRKVQQTISTGDHSTILQAGGDIYLNISTTLADKAVENEIEELHKSRFFPEFDQIMASLRLGMLLAYGSLSCGSNELRGLGLAWCARLLSRSEEVEKADHFLSVARTLGDYPEIKIAEAFILSQKGDKETALKTLASINSNASRSAALMIVAHHDGNKNAINWMNLADYKAKDLDSDGKAFLLSHQLNLGFWDDAAQTVDVFSETDFEGNPILHRLTAFAKLITAVPPDFRTVVLTQVPFNAHGFRLAADAVGMGARRAAHKHFLSVVEATKRLACSGVARVDDEYALWLELRDPEMVGHGKNRLESKLRDPDTRLGALRYALQFGIKLDLDTVERDIERHVVINGGMTLEAAIARLALAFTMPTPEEAANYIVRHHDQLATQVNPKLIQFHQIEMFSLAGLTEKANEVINQLVKQGITPEEEGSLRRIIAEAEGNDPLESRRARFKQTGSLSDLIILVARLEEHQQWDDLCEYGRRLFEVTRSLEDAERLVNAFNNAHRSAALVDFLNVNPDLLSQSRILQMSHAWGLYHEGLLLKSRTALAKLSEDSENPNYRALQVNLGISMGDWASLSDFAAEEYRNRENRTPYDLIRAAKLVLHLESPRAKALVFEAANKAGDDAEILATAYFISTNAGWEDSPQVFRWIERAAEVSGDNGPLKRMTLRDIFELKPEWDRRESETWRLLAQGKIPVFIAAHSLNRTLIDLTTFPALANPFEPDPRRRSPIPAYSGKRVPLEFDVRGKTVALDATALLTLSFLEILDLALDAFNTVYITHSTLGWLFEERQKASFHQPSRIANAHQLRDLLAMDLLEKFTAGTVASSELSAQVGDELAALIAEAEKARDGGDTQHIVVRTAPVHRLSSLLEEEADLSGYAAVLSSCLAVVGKLKQKGQITSEEEKRARAYLQMHEKPWPNQPEITDGATLYLDGLASTYLQHLGLLGKFKAAGLRAVVSPKLVSEADALISYEHISDKAKDIIERIRNSLNLRIESGHVKVSERRLFDESREKAVPEHPTVGILTLTTKCDAVFVDDRFINQHANVDISGISTRILSTSDLLDGLVAAGLITDDEQLEYRTRLRRANYFFVSVSEDELDRCLRDSEIVEGEVVETAELKAIRESVLRVRMGDWLQLPDEASWLNEIFKSFVHVLRNLWKGDADVAQALVYSNWLAQQLDIRGWAHCLVPENADNIIRTDRGVFLLSLLRPLSGARQSIADAYCDWVEEKILVSSCIN